MLSNIAKQNGAVTKTPRGLTDIGKQRTAQIKKPRGISTLKGN